VGLQGIGQGVFAQIWLGSLSDRRTGDERSSRSNVGFAGDTIDNSQERSTQGLVAARGSDAHSA
jgi:hypothetical protein